MGRITFALGLNVYLELTTQYQKSNSQKVSVDEYLMAPASGAANIGRALKLLDKQDQLDVHLFAIIGPKKPQEGPIGKQVAEALKYELRKQNISPHLYFLRAQQPVSNNIIERNSKGKTTYQKGIRCKPPYTITNQEKMKITRDVCAVLDSEDSWLVLASVAPEDVVLAQSILGHAKHATRVIILSGELIKSKELRLEKIFSSADYLIQNEEETRALLGEKSQVDWLYELHQLTKKNVIVTLGKEKAIAQTETGQFIEQKAFHVKTVDPTGVGDAFVGGFLYARCKGDNFQQALRWGAAVGAVQATKLGGQPKITRANVEAMLNNGYYNKLFSKQL
jgi:sugar/nucleoside kinase (ribokinase family)